MNKREPASLTSSLLAEKGTAVPTVDPVDGPAMQATIPPPPAVDVAPSAPPTQPPDAAPFADATPRRDKAPARLVKLKDFFIVKKKSGRRESNPREQLGRLPFYH